jgi:two-component system response regulator NreC
MYRHTVVRILLADDHQVVREGIRALLERAGFEVVADAEDGQEAVRLARSHRPDIAVLDLAMPRLDGIECAREILAAKPEIGIVLLTVHADEHQVVAAFRAGVRGYVVKTQASSELALAIREVNRGATYVSGKVSRALVNRYVGNGSSPAALSGQLRETLRLIATGKTTKEIAAVLGVSVKTVELYRSRIMTRLDIHDTAGLVRHAIRCGLVTL